MTRTVKKPDVRKQEIIEAAMALFLEKTYESSTTTDVMRSLGIAKGTIYHYFASKSDLLDAVVQTMADQYIQRRLPSVEACSGNALEKISCLFDRAQQSDQEKNAMADMHQQGNVILHIRLLVALVEKLSPVLGELIAEGCQQKLFQTGHPLEAAELLLSGIQFLTDEGIHSWPQETLVRRTAAFPAMVERMLGAEPGAFAFLA